MKGFKYLFIALLVITIQIVPNASIAYWDYYTDWFEKEYYDDVDTDECYWYEYADDWYYDENDNSDDWYAEDDSWYYDENYNLDDWYEEEYYDDVDTDECYWYEDVDDWYYDENDNSDDWYDEKYYTDENQSTQTSDEKLISMLRNFFDEHEVTNPNSIQSAEGVGYVDLVVKRIEGDTIFCETRHLEEVEFSIYEFEKKPKVGDIVNINSDGLYESGPAIADTFEKNSTIKAKDLVGDTDNMSLEKLLKAFGNICSNW